VRNKLKRIEALESEQRAFYAEGENFNKESRQLLNVSATNIQVSCSFINVFQDWIQFLGMCISLTCMMCLYKVEKRKSVPVHTMKAYGGRRGIVPLILNLGCRWRCVAAILHR
jgi:hypothetical protein